MSQPLDFYEKKARLSGYNLVAGVDEAGRGPLAGPVVAACCFIPLDVIFPGINDSKKLSSQQRADFYHQITLTPGAVYGIGIVESFIIDKINILQATMKAMQLAIFHMPIQPDYLLVDGNKLPSLDIPAQALIGGDSLSQSIMAAAILAKYTRDQIMLKAHRFWPSYGFDKHKGYGTPHHLEKLREHGTSPIHRDWKLLRNFASGLKQGS